MSTGPAGFLAWLQLAGSLLDGHLYRRGQFVALAAGSVAPGGVAMVGVNVDGAGGVPGVAGMLLR